MRVLVAGATSALGTSLVQQLVSHGHHVLGVTSRRGSLLRPGSHGTYGSAVTEIVADVRDRRSVLDAVEGRSADAVVNLLGAHGSYPAGFRGMRAVNRLRHEGTSTMVAVASAVGATRLVGTSSFYGYGFADHGDESLDETRPFGEPDDSRNDALQIGLTSSEQQVRAVGGIVLRLGHLYRFGAHSVPPVARRWSGSLPVVHIDDAARAALLSLDAGNDRDIFNIASARPTSWRMLQEAQSKVDGFARPVALPESVVRKLAPFASQLITRTSMRLTTEAARAKLGWTAQHPSIDSVLESVLPANMTAAVGGPA